MVVVMVVLVLLKGSGSRAECRGTVAFKSRKLLYLTAFEVDGVSAAANVALTAERLPDLDDAVERRRSL